MTFEPLYHKGKDGALRVWRVWTEGNLIKTEAGQIGGQVVPSEKSAEGKNIGKSNETTPTEQAESEAQSMWQHKLDRKYSLTPNEAQKALLLPMLAKEYDPKRVRFPAAIQRKLDGNRSLAMWEDGKVRMLSRSGKDWTVPVHIIEQLQMCMPHDMMCDGEFYLHGKSCQTITSWVKKLRPETYQVEYHIYDFPMVGGDDTLSFEDRWRRGVAALNRSEAGEPNIVLVFTHEVTSHEDVKNFETRCIEEGYEGAIVRNLNGKYLFGYRSYDLLKVKTFQDAEFEVIGCKEGRGKYEGCAIWICKNDLTDAEFDVTCAVTMEEKALSFQNRHSYIGKKLTVKFFDRTDDQLPRFPVGKMFRDTKDLS